ncbi:MAG TPA: beta-propeller fold lactonase family protein [Kineosporiaceae bacterium]|nr:beta-propeller fold lactonase family protein [Kineosporiaceae bacterium]
MSGKRPLTLLAGLGGTVLCLGLAAAPAGAAGPAGAQGSPQASHAAATAGTTRLIGTVFVGTNHNNTSDPREPANEVVMYGRRADGSLTPLGRFATGGQGSGPGQRFAGDGLGAGNSVRLSTDRRWLFVTNAGSNTVSVFKVMPNRLVLTSVSATGDGSRSHRFPNSVTQRGNLVYVLNAADDGSITGFRLTRSGGLTPLPGSTRGLAANQKRFAPDALYDPTEIEFTPDGRHLVVTIKDGPSASLAPGAQPTGPGRVLVWDVDRHGRPSARFTRTDFANRGPFGFSFDRRGHLLVAQFVGGPVETVAGTRTITGAAGSFRITKHGRLTPITLAAADHQVDTCWLVNNGRYAYAANYTSGTVSSFRIGRNGSLTLLKSVAGTTDHPANVQGSTPLDARVSPDGKSLYVVLPGSGKVAAWNISPDGELSKIGEFAGLPRTVDGDQAPADFTALGSPAGIDVR